MAVKKLRQQGMGHIGAIIAIVTVGLIVCGIIYFGPGVWEKTRGAGRYKAEEWQFGEPPANNAPTLTNGSVTPDVGTTGISYTYEVTYTDSDGDAPSYIKVYYFGWEHSMDKVSGTYMGGATYRYTVIIASPGSWYTYYFEASDGTDTVRLPSSGTFSGPIVGTKVKTSLSISPSTFTVQSDDSINLTATLKDENNNPLAGKTISWSEASDWGTFSLTSDITDSEGQVSVTYTAPIVDNQTSVTVTASFGGDNQYQSSSGTSSGTISAAPLSSTTLSISPSSFTLQSGNSTTLTATLKDENDNLLAGKTISWIATSGSVSPSSGTTNSSGQVSVTYTAPTVDTSTSVTVSASFAGDSSYGSSSDNSSGAINPFQVTLTFRMPDGTPLANTAIYYGFSSDNESKYLGTTDNEGKIISDNHELADQTIYFKTADGEYTGNSSITSTGGEITAELAEVPATEVPEISELPISEPPILWVVAGVAIIVMAVGITVFIKKRRH